MREEEEEVTGGIRMQEDKLGSNRAQKLISKVRLRPEIDSCLAS